MAKWQRRQHLAVSSYLGTGMVACLALFVTGLLSAPILPGAASILAGYLVLFTFVTFVSWLKSEPKVNWTTRITQMIGYLLNYCLPAFVILGGMVLFAFPLSAAVIPLSISFTVLALYGFATMISEYTGSGGSLYFEVFCNLVKLMPLFFFLIIRVFRRCIVARWKGVIFLSY